VTASPDRVSERPLKQDLKTAMADQNDDNQPERITVLAKDFTPAAMEFHRRNMSAKGYRMEGQIVPRKFQMIEGMGEPSDLFEGENFYAVTFVRKSEQE